MVRAPKGTALVNFPYILRKAVVIDREIRKTDPYLEVGYAYHNGKWWEVYRHFRNGQWTSFRPLPDDYVPLSQTRSRD